MNLSKAQFQLLTDFKMPMFGLGTYLVNDVKSVITVLDEALATGYRLIDTAYMYGNERHIGNALKKLLPKYNLKRQDIFITSKLPPTEHGENALVSLQRSISDLQCGYLDLYLIHWPGCCDYDPRDPENAVIRDKTWATLVTGKISGMVRSLGVSNYTVSHLKQLLSNCYGVVPAVNQIEWHPHWHNDEMYNFCKDNGILLQAYFSLGGTERKELLKDSTIIDIAEAIGKTPAQVLLVWSLQQNVAVIPKSTLKTHLQMNTNLNFTIPEDHMHVLCHMHQTRYGSDPTIVY